MARYRARGNPVGVPAGTLTLTGNVESDVNQRAYATVQAATGEAPAKNPAAVALGKLGGAKGGKARAAALSAKRRSAIAIGR